MDPNIAIALGNNPALFALAQQIAHAGRRAGTRVSKRRQPYDGETGPAAAAQRASRYRVCAGSASTLKKAMRVQRIRNGERPLRYGPADREA